MTPQKRLKSIAQSFAHHSASALSFVHPHLGETCKQNKLTGVQIHLLKTPMCSATFSTVKAIRLSLENLRKTFFELTEKEGIEQKLIESVVVTFQFDQLATDCYWNTCTVRLTTQESRTFEATVNCVGKTLTQTYGTSEPPK